MTKMDAIASWAEEGNSLVRNWHCHLLMRYNFENTYCENVFEFFFILVC